MEVNSLVFVCLGVFLPLVDHLFSECPLKDFEICDRNFFFEVVDGLLLSKDQRVCFSCIGELAEVVVPDSVEELCEWCFFWCSSLSRVTFGESSSLKLIGKRE